MGRRLSGAWDANMPLLLLIPLGYVLIYAATNIRSAGVVQAGLFAIFVICLAGIVGAFVRYCRRVRAHAMKRRRLDAESFAMEFMRLFPAGAYDRSVNVRLVKALCEMGLVGDAFRYVRSRDYAPIVPIAHAFEPRALDEADAGFQELEAGIGGARAEREVSSPFRLWKRNFALAGGVGPWVTLGFLTLLLVLDTVVSGRPSSPVALVFALVLVSVVAPRGLTSPFRQWLVVPGGVFVRRSGLFGRRWKTHLLEGAQSVLLVRPIRGGPRWLACVADAETSEAEVLTRSEVDLLLAAWICPHPPPSPAHLAEFR